MIHIKNARNNNLNNIDVKIPKQQITVITGVSGSGKSSIAFDLIYEEGRKKYLQSLGMAFELDEGKYDSIIGLSPTVALKQSLTRQTNPRSTVGSKTGLLKMLALLYKTEGRHDLDTFVDDEELDEAMFSYLSTTGMCYECAGMGSKYTVHLENIVDDSMSVKDVFVELGATPGYLNLLERKYSIQFHEKFVSLPLAIQDEFTYGIFDMTTGKSSYCIERILQLRYSKGEEINNLYSHDICESCHGYRISEEARSVTIKNQHIGHLATMDLDTLKQHMSELLNSDEISAHGKQLVQSILVKIEELVHIKLSHMSLYRELTTLSGGELQRIFLHSHLRSDLDSLIYVFDEPTGGLHASEKEVIIDSFHELKRQGNTVIIVTHDSDVIQQADYVVDVGPKAGVLGGNIMYEGNLEGFLSQSDLLTVKYLQSSHIEKRVRQAINLNSQLTLIDASANNLKNIDVTIPLNRLVGIAGTSGSGKSSLITSTLVPRVKSYLRSKKEEGIVIHGSTHIKEIIEVNQEPIGRKSNSNPVSYLGVWDKIRELYASQSKAIALGLSAGDFSFNSKGACPECKGSGKSTVVLSQDISFDKVCSKCHGERFNETTKSVMYQGKNIVDVLDMSIDGALTFFMDSGIPLKSLEVLSQTGMGYMKLGQASNTLSGGEAQRIKLAKELGKARLTNTIYILDEPSIGLSQYDITKLIHLLDELVQQGNSVIVIEHDLDVIRSCDWLIEVGPSSGKQGGMIVAQGNIETLRKHPDALTGRYL